MSLIEKALIKSKSQPPSLGQSPAPLAGPRLDHLLGGPRRIRPRTTLMVALCVVSLIAIAAAWLLVSHAPEVAHGVRETTRTAVEEEANPQGPPPTTTEHAGPEPLNEAPVAAVTEPSTGRGPLPPHEFEPQGTLAQVTAGPNGMGPKAPERPSALPEARRTPAAPDGHSAPQGKAKEGKVGQASPSVPRKQAGATEDRKEVLLEKAFLNGQAGNTGAAIQIYNQVLQEEPDCFEALLNRGILRERSGDHVGAKVDLLRAKELRPHDPLLLNALGVLYLNLGEPDQAAIYLKMAAEPFSMINLALLYWRRGEQERALGCLDEAQMRNPHDPHIPYYKGILLSQQGHHRQAQQEMDRAAILARKRGDMDLLRRLEAIALRP